MNAYLPDADPDYCETRQRISELFVNPDIENILLGAPRFRWLLLRWPTCLTAEMRLGDAIGLLWNREHVAPHILLELIEHLADYTAALLATSLEDGDKIERSRKLPHASHGISRPLPIADLAYYCVFRPTVDRLLLVVARS